MGFYKWLGSPPNYKEKAFLWFPDHINTRLGDFSVLIHGHKYLFYKYTIIID